MILKQGANRVCAAAYADKARKALFSIPLSLTGSSTFRVDLSVGLRDVSAPLTGGLRPRANCPAVGIGAVQVVGMATQPLDATPIPRLASRTCPNPSCQPFLGPKPACQGGGRPRRSWRNPHETSRSRLPPHNSACKCSVLHLHSPKASQG